MIIGACFPELCGFSITCNENSTLTLAHAHWGECANAYSKRSHHYVELALNFLLLWIEQLQVLFLGK